MLDEQKFNLEVRKVLKRFGVNAQREIEKAVHAAIDAGSLSGDETLDTRIELNVVGLDLDFLLRDTIALS